MLKRIKAKLKARKEENVRRREERERIAREIAEEKARLECARIQAEKDELMALSEKELMVEAILALKGYNTRLNNIEEQQKDLLYAVNSLKLDVNVLDSSVDELKNKIDNITIEFR